MAFRSRVVFIHCVLHRQNKSPVRRTFSCLQSNVYLIRAVLKGQCSLFDLEVLKMFSLQRIAFSTELNRFLMNRCKSVVCFSPTHKHKICVYLCTYLDNFPIFTLLSVDNKSVDCSIRSQLTPQTKTVIYQNNSGVATLQSHTI